MADDTETPNADDVVERKPVQIRFSVSQDWLENELLPAYPNATKASQAARQACLDGVDHREETNKGVRATIDSEVIAALKKLGGEVENCQVVRIGATDEVIVDEAQEVDVDE